MNKGNRTYSLRNQEKLREYLRKIERNDVKPVSGADRTVREQPSNNRDNVLRPRDEQARRG